MKLINKISRYFLFNSIVIFIIVSIGLYFIIENPITAETDEQLSNIVQKAKLELTIGNTVSVSPFFEILSIDLANEINEFKDVMIKSNEEEDGEPFRQLTSFANINRKHYKIIARISLIEKEDMLISILIVALAAFVLFILVLYFTNKTVSKNILGDFYDTLNKLKNFSLKNDDELQLVDSKIDEFKQLNKSVLFLSKRAKSEYRSLKEFSEEMNHEIQTPIAVIKSKLEILLQSSNLDENNLSLLDSAIRNLSKFERINKSILLLNKLDNKNLFDSSEINLTEEIKNIIFDFSDSIASKYLTVNFSLLPAVVINTNQSLMIILLNNLVSNAIKHNIQNGIINLELKENELTISNTGQIPKDSTERFFARFYKESTSTESVGLGLTIVKKICDLYGLELTNEFPDGLHSLKLKFN